MCVYVCVCVCVCVCAGEGGGGLLMLVVFCPFVVLVCCNAWVFMTDRYIRCVVLVSGAFITTLSALSLRAVPNKPHGFCGR